MRTNKTFEWLEAAQVRIQAETAGMTVEEEVEYWRIRTEALRLQQQSVTESAASNQARKAS